MENFNGLGHYRDPEFVFERNVAPTGLTFLTSDSLGKQYRNDLFVADVNNGNIYRFDLNENRTGFALNGSLADKKSDDLAELDDIIFARGFSGITDIEVGPDGYIYVLSVGTGKLYRIVPS